MSEDPTRIVNLLIVEDQDLILNALISLFDSQAEFNVVGTASNMEELKWVVGRIEPDLALVDMMLNGEKFAGLDATTVLLNSHPEIKVIGISSSDDHYFVDRFIQVGAHGFLYKGDGFAVYKDAIKSVLNGNSFVSPHIVERRLSDSNHEKEVIALNTLSKRELEVLKALTDGKSQNDISKLLSLSASTVRTYKSHICAKLGVETDGDLFNFSARHHLVRDVN